VNTESVPKYLERLKKTVKTFTHEPRNIFLTTYADDHIEEVGDYNLDQLVDYIKTDLRDVLNGSYRAALNNAYMLGYSFVCLEKLWDNNERGSFGEYGNWTDFSQAETGYKTSQINAYKRLYNLLRQYPRFRNVVETATKLQKKAHAITAYLAQHKKTAEYWKKPFEYEDEEQEEDEEDEEDDTDFEDNTVRERSPAY
jgi:hypothetical protein